MKKSFFMRNIRRWLPGVLISIVALFVVFNVGSLDDITLAFKSIRPLNLLIALVLTIISLGTRALAWRTLLDNRPSVLRAFYIVNIGYLLNNVFPLRAGEIGRAVFMGRDTGLGPLHVLSTIVIERAFDVAMAAGLLLATLPLVLNMQGAQTVAFATLVLVILGLVVLFLVARYHERVLQIIERIAGRWDWFNRLVLPRLGAILRGFGVLTRPSQFLISLFWIAASWAIWVFVYWVMLLQISPNSPLWHSAFVDSTLAMGIAIPSAPGGLGLFEGAIVGALALLNITEGALGYAILMHVFQFVVTAVLGLIGLVSEGKTLSSALTDIQRSETAG